MKGNRRRKLESARPQETIKLKFKTTLKTSAKGECHPVRIEKLNIIDTYSFD